MSRVNRSNAVIGWVTLEIVKRAVRRNVKAAAPAAQKRKRRTRVVAVVVATGVGAATLLRFRSSGDESAT